MIIQMSVLIDRPVADVWRFYATDHARNHPRWDPDIQLDPADDRPLGLGSVLLRHSTRSGTLVEGTMEVARFDPESCLAMRVTEGPVAMDSFAYFVAPDPHHTLLTLGADIPWLEESSTSTFLRDLLRRNIGTLKALAEADIPAP